MTMLAKAPSLVIKSRPSLFRSSRPTGYTLAGASSTRSVTHRRPISSAVVVTKPRGLCSMM